MTTEIEFKPWPKTPRLFRSILITEKLDGTNAAVIVTDDGRVAAQSRNRLITPDADNYGFARWVHARSDKLAATLGPGHHYGEWWGSGIQRGYGLTGGDKRLSLFNTHRYKDAPLDEVDGLGLVPELARINTLDSMAISEVLDGLRSNGSTAAPGFMRPEGVIVFLSASQQVYKVLLENDNQPKGNKESN